MNDPVETMHRAVEFIEAHLESETSVAQIAAAVGYSVFHFMRTFDHVVQHTPYDYLMRRRLSEAARGLTSSERRIIDISQDFCFNNHETFTRAFKRMFGLPPNEWRERGRSTTALLMPPLTMEDLRFINQEGFSPPGIKEFETIRLCGLMTACEDQRDGVESQRFRLLDDLRGGIGDRIPGCVIGITTTPDENTQHAYYRVGVDKAGLSAVPPAFVEFSLPEGKYICIDVPKMNSHTAIKYLLHTWLPMHGLTATLRMEVEFMQTSTNATGSNTICIPLSHNGLPKNNMQGR